MAREPGPACRSGRSALAPGPTLPSWTFRRVTDANPAARSCGSRSPAPASSSHRALPTPGTYPSPSARWAPSPPRAALGSGALAHLPALELEHALHRVLVEPQQVRHGPVPEGRVLFDHGLDGRDDAVLQRRAGFDWPAVHRAPGHLEPLAQFTDRDGDAAAAGTPNAIYTVESVAFNEKSPAVSWVTSAANADGIDLTHTRPAGDLVSLAQDVEARRLAAPGGSSRSLLVLAHPCADARSSAQANHRRANRGHRYLRHQWRDLKRQTNGRSERIAGGLSSD